jgi:hypothetical protein
MRTHCSILFASFLLCIFLFGCDTHPVDDLKDSVAIPEAPKRPELYSDKKQEAVELILPEPTSTPIPAMEKTILPELKEDTEDIQKWREEEFKRIHGTAYNPLSRVDRKKFEKIYPSDFTPKTEPELPQEPQEEPKPIVVPEHNPDLPTEGQVRSALVEEASKFIGIRETKGNNRSPEIDDMNLTAGSYLGAPWCASSMYKAAVNVGERFSIKPPYPKTARAITMGKQFSLKNQSPQPGDTFYVGDYSHTGMFESWGAIGLSTITLEGNTSPAGATVEQDREGHGFYRKKRLKASLQYGADWVTNNIQPKKQND